MNQDLFEHRLPPLGALRDGSPAVRHPVAADRETDFSGNAEATPDRHLDDFLPLMQVQHDSAKALHEAHRQALKHSDPKVAQSAYDQAHAAIADHFDGVAADKADWAQALRRDLEADRQVHKAQLRQKSSVDPVDAAKQQFGNVLGSYAKMAGEGDAGRFADRTLHQGLDPCFAGEQTGSAAPHHAAV